MDGREMHQENMESREEALQEQISKESIPLPEKKKNSRKGILLIGLLMGIAVIGGLLYLVLFLNKEQGYQDYTVQMKQYFVEYSDKYDYWDVLTVEYPQIEGIDEEIQGKFNTLMYDTAMDRVNYWHLNPSEEVKEFQENYTMFCSDVSCQATYHSQYLLSLDYQEYYCAGNPVWATNGTERAVTLDLVTGQSYTVSDILEINYDFVRLWDKIRSDRYEMSYGSEEDMETLLLWFTQSDEEINQKYFCRPFFYVTEEKDLAIGVSFDPILKNVYNGEPIRRVYCEQLCMEDLEAFKKESEFWNKYEKSEPAGEVLPCEDKKENIWLGKDAGIWNYDY